MPRPIHDKVSLENLAEVTDAMAGYELTPDQEDYFDLLCRLIGDHEREKATTKLISVNAIDALQHLLEENAMTGADLSRLLGAHRSLVNPRTQIERLPVVYETCLGRLASVAPAVETVL